VGTDGGAVSKNFDQFDLPRPLMLINTTIVFVNSFSKNSREKRSERSKEHEDSSKQHHSKDRRDCKYFLSCAVMFSVNIIRDVFSKPDFNC